MSQRGRGFSFAHILPCYYHSPVVFSISAPILLHCSHSLFSFGPWQGTAREVAQQPLVDSLLACGERNHLVHE